MIEHRVDGWSPAMRAAIARHQQIPFAWGISDCAIMCGDVIRAITGRHVLAGHRWASRIGALRALSDAGFRDAVSFFTHGLAEVDPNAAMRGDLCMIEHDGDPLMSPAIIDGPYAFSKAQDGAVVVPRHLITRAWSL